MGVLSLLGTSLGLGLLSGISFYATVLALGLGIRFEIFDLAPELEGLQILANTWVLGAAAVAYLVEFFADKIPWVDSAWDALHTLIRPLGAALLASAAFGELDTAMRFVLTGLSGGLAFAGHSSKAATRLAINHSPEPFSNIAVSLAEDAFVPLGLWFVMSHPVAALFLAVSFLAVFFWLMGKIFRIFSRRVSSAGEYFRRRRTGTAL